MSTKRYAQDGYIFEVSTHLPEPGTPGGVKTRILEFDGKDLVHHPANWIPVYVNLSD